MGTFNTSKVVYEKWFQVQVIIFYIIFLSRRQLFFLFGLCALILDFLFVVQNHGGNIVNISATLPYKGQALQVHAGSAKAANGNNIICLYTQTLQNRMENSMAHLSSYCPKMQ